MDGDMRIETNAVGSRGREAGMKSHILRQLRLEGLEVTPEGRLTPRDSESDGVPVVLVARTQDGDGLVLIDSALPESIRRLLHQTDLAHF